MSFFDSTQGISQSYAVTNGVTQVPLKVVGVGFHQIKAVYSGDTKNPVLNSDFVTVTATGTGIFSIYGTTALLYASRQATRAWNLADYTPPNRRWYYDPLLAETDPPGFKPKRYEERGRRIVLW